MKNTIDLNELEALLCGYWLSDISNFAAYMADHMDDINWVGFYLDDGRLLRLASFIGKPACLDIAYTRGVCGHAFTKQTTTIVDDVHLFPGHIACDERSRSEMVIPFYINNKIVGVLDLDSPLVARFKTEDKLVLEKAVEILSKKNSRTPASVRPHFKLKLFYNRVQIFLSLFNKIHEKIWI